MTGLRRGVLGIDAGTTSVKAVLYSLDGQTLATGHRAVAVVHGAFGRAESSMADVWTAVVGAVRDATATGYSVEGIGVTGQGDGAWLIDATGHPVRDAALWLDGRGARRVAEWEQDGRGDAVIDATGSAVFAGTLPVLLEELAQDEPDVLMRAAHHVNCKDWIRFRLVGEVATDPSEASRTYLDTHALTYSDALIDRLDHERWRSLLPPLRDPHEQAGRLLAGPASELGLPAGIPVAIGLVDSAASPLGLGTISDGDGCIVLGTTATVAVNHASRDGVRSDVAIVIPTGRGAQVLEALSAMVGTPNLDWAKRVLGFGETDWATIEASLAEIPPGSRGVVYLPYGSPSGERAPFVATTASSSWVGTSVSTTSAELLRSVFEGLAFAMTECLDIAGTGDEVRICGGGARSDLMCRILADVSRRTVVRIEDPEVGARGAATLALVAAGIDDSIPDAVHRLRTAGTRFTPHPDRRLDAARALFTDVRAALRPHWPALRRLRDDESLEESP